MPGLLLLLLIKAVVIGLPITVCILAFRRLVLSRSANAWLYSAVGLFALVTAIGLLPWALIGQRSHPVFLVFSAMMPAVWYAVVIICNSKRSLKYDTEMERTLNRLLDMAGPSKPLEPLVLTDPILPEAPTPVFRHSRPMVPEADTPAPTTKAVAKVPARFSETTRTILDIARSMRTNVSSDGRRIKLLPPPAGRSNTHLPFLRSGKTV